LIFRSRFLRLQTDKQLLEEKITQHNKRIEIQKREIEIQRNIARHQRDQIEKQNQMIEHLAQDLEKKISERTAELELALKKAKESDQLKSAFLSNMSHEIRTPMNAIIGFSDLLIDDSFTAEEKQNYSELIRMSGDHLLSLLNDIIDISMIESGQLKLALNTVNLNDLMRDVYLSSIGNRMLKSKNGSVRLLFVPYHEQIILYTDQLRVKQVLFNLVNNAIKFTNEGYIEISAEIIDRFAQVKIKDTGIGISAEYISTIFNRFIKLDKNNRNTSGNGLGLTISRNLIEKLGGRIWVESTPGQGSEFYFTLPVK
jgi:signal transduction histidine kinase